MAFINQILSLDPFKGKAIQIADKRGDIISPGRAKSRIHLFDKTKNDALDRFAIAAKKIDSNHPKLNFFERHFYLLHKHGEGRNAVWYKINKNSLVKRLGVNKESLNAFVDHKGFTNQKTFEKFLCKQAQKLGIEKEIHSVEPVDEKSEGQTPPHLEEGYVKGLNQEEQKLRQQDILAAKKKKSASEAKKQQEFEKKKLDEEREKLELSQKKREAEVQNKTQETEAKKIEPQKGPGAEINQQQALEQKKEEETRKQKIEEQVNNLIAIGHTLLSHPNTEAVYKGFQNNVEKLVELLQKECPENEYKSLYQPLMDLIEQVKNAGEKAKASEQKQIQAEELKKEPLEKQNQSKMLDVQASAVEKNPPAPELGTLAFLKLQLDNLLKQGNELFDNPSSIPQDVLKAYQQQLETAHISLKNAFPNQEHGMKKYLESLSEQIEKLNKLIERPDASNPPPPPAELKFHVDDSYNTPKIQEPSQAEAKQRLQQEQLLINEKQQFRQYLDEQIPGLNAIIQNPSNYTSEYLAQVNQNIDKAYRDLQQFYDLSTYHSYFEELRGYYHKIVEIQANKVDHENQVEHKKKKQI